MPEIPQSKQIAPQKDGQGALFSVNTSGGDPAKIDKDLKRFRKELAAYNKKNGTKISFPGADLANALSRGGEISAFDMDVFRLEIIGKKASLFHKGKDSRKEFSLNDPIATLKVDRAAVKRIMEDRKIRKGLDGPMLFSGKDGKCYEATFLKWEETAFGIYASKISLKEVPRPKPDEEQLASLKTDFLNLNNKAPGSLEVTGDYHLLASSNEFKKVGGPPLTLRFSSGATIKVTGLGIDKSATLEIPKDENTDQLWLDAYSLQKLWDIYEEYKGKPTGTGTGYPADEVKRLLKLKESVGIRLSKLMGKNGFGKPQDIKRMTVECNRGFAFNCEFIGTDYFAFWDPAKEKPTKEEPAKQGQGEQAGILPSSIHYAPEVSVGMKNLGGLEYPAFAVAGRPVSIFLPSGSKAAMAPVFVTDAQDNEVFNGLPGPGGQVSFVPRGSGELKYSMLTSEGKSDFTLKVGIVKIKLPKYAVREGETAGIKISFDYGGDEHPLQAQIRLVRDGKEAGVFSADSQGIYSFPAGPKGSGYEIYASGGGQPIGSFKLAVQ